MIRFISRYSLYIKNASLYFLASFITAIIGLLINPLMAIYMSPEDYAISGYFSSFSLLLLPLLNFSLVTYFSRNYVRMDEERRKVVADTLLKALLLLGAIGMPLLGTVFYYFFKLNHISFPVFPYFAFIVSTTFFNNFLVMLQISYRMERKAKKYFKLTLGTSLLATILSVLFVVLMKGGAVGYLLAPCLASIIVAIFAYKKLFSFHKFDVKIVKEAFKFGWPLSLSAVFWYFISGVDKAMLEGLHDSYQFGLYNVAFAISSKFAIFYTAIATTFEPDIYKLVAEDKKKKLFGVCGLVWLLVTLPNLLFIPFSSFVIDILTAGRYTEAAGYARLLILSNVTVAMYYLLIMVLVGYGYTKVELFIRVIGAAISFGVYRYMISTYHFNGGAIAQSLSFLILSGLVVIFLVYKFKGFGYAKNRY